METMLYIEESEVPKLTPYMRRSSLVVAAEGKLKKATRNLKRKLYQYMYAIEMMDFVPVQEKIQGWLCTDGEHIYYNPRKIRNYRYYNHGRIRSVGECEAECIDMLEYALAHILMHGMLGHFDAYKDFRNSKLVSVVMDMQVRQLLDKMGITRYFCCDEEDEAEPIRNKDIMKGYALYYEALRSRSKKNYLLHRGPYYFIDDHAYWKKEVSKKWIKAREIILGKNAASLTVEQTMQRIMEIKNGDGRNKFAGNTEMNNTEKVRAAKENDMSYRELIWKLVKDNEYEKELPDSIDVMLYSYGLELYEDVPLVEPSEVNEVTHLNTLVIAIDTSGSCSGDTAGRFIRETCNLLRDIESIARFDEIRLIQCDMSIKEERVFESVDEMSIDDEYILYGFGGTSFVPVIERVAELQNNEEKKIDALIYLTDTYGEFPDEEPDFPVYLIVPEDETDYYREPLNDDIPTWAQCIILL